MARVLIVGESAVAVSSQIVGFDLIGGASFPADEAPSFKETLERGGHEVSRMSAQEAQSGFPTAAEELSGVDVLILSDVGANTLLLHPDAYLRGVPTPNRLRLIRDWTLAGGGLAMCGGYLSFAGFGGRAFYGGTPVEEVLPVRVSPFDDRVETPEGVRAETLAPHHAILRDVGGGWPLLLGYNRVEPAPDSTVLARANGDPLLVVGEAGAGRTLAWTSDVGPHWCPDSFVAWKGYENLWRRAVGWLGREC